MGDRHRRLGEGDLVGHLRLPGVGDERGRDGRVDPHPAPAFVEQGQDLVEAVRARTRRTVVAEQVHVEVDRVIPRRAVELRHPLLVEPARAEGIGHRGQERHVVAPAGLSAKADAVDPGIAVVDRGGDVRDVAPGGIVRHGHARRLDQVLAVHDHGALAVERRRVELAVRRQSAAHGGQEVVDVVVRTEIERFEPAPRPPDRRLVHADRHHVELAALGGDVGGDALPQRPFLERHPVDRDAGIGLLEMAGQLLHLDHVAVVDGRDGDLARQGRRSENRRGGPGERCLQRLHVFPPGRAVVVDPESYWPLADPSNRIQPLSGTIFSGFRRSSPISVRNCKFPGRVFRPLHPRSRPDGGSNSSSPPPAPVAGLPESSGTSTRQASRRPCPPSCAMRRAIHSTNAVRVMRLLRASPPMTAEREGLRRRFVPCWRLELRTPPVGRPAMRPPTPDGGHGRGFGHGAEPPRSPSRPRLHVPRRSGAEPRRSGAEPRQE